MPEEIPAVADPAPEEIVAPVSAPVESAVADPAPDCGTECDGSCSSEDAQPGELATKCPNDEDAHLPTVDEFRAIQSRLSALEAHFLQVVGHLAQSFGDVYKAKHDSLKGA